MNELKNSGLISTTQRNFSINEKMYNLQRFHFIGLCVKSYISMAVFGRKWQTCWHIMNDSNLLDKCEIYRSRQNLILRISIPFQVLWYVKFSTQNEYCRLELNNLGWPFFRCKFDGCSSMSRERSALRFLNKIMFCELFSRVAKPLVQIHRFKERYVTKDEKHNHEKYSCFLPRPLVLGSEVPTRFRHTKEPTEEYLPQDKFQSSLCMRWRNSRNVAPA